MSDLLEAVVVDVPEECADAWARVEASGVQDRMKRALLRVAHGEAVRQAAEAEGYASHAETYRAAKRFGLIDSQKQQLVAGCRRVARLTNEELERRLVEAPEDVSTRDLVVANGVAIDKIAKAERWSQEHSEGGSFSEVLQQMWQEFKKSGMKLEMAVSPHPDEDSAAETIDVTEAGTRHGGVFGM